MTKTAIRTHYLVPRAALERLSVDAVLDMLRHDGARVECNPPTGFYLLSNTLGPNVARWASFGITVSHTAKSDRELWQLMEWGRGQAVANPTLLQ